MSRSGTQPGILISDLMSGDGPHAAMADHFVVQRCEACDSRVTGQLVVHRQALTCASCLAADAHLLGV